jgi:hypothetical protein
MLVLPHQHPTHIYETKRLAVAVCSQSFRSGEREVLVDALHVSGSLGNRYTEAPDAGIGALKFGEQGGWLEREVTVLNLLQFRVLNGQVATRKGHNGGDGRVGKALCEYLRPNEACVAGEYDFHGQEVLRFVCERMRFEAGALIDVNHAVCPQH